MNLVLGVYLGGIPITIALVVSVGEFDVWLLVRAAWRWWRADGRYGVGPGSTARGYQITGAEPPAPAAGDGDRAAATVGEPGEWTADVVLKAKHAPAGAPAREAGELLALEELDQTGLAITSEGALVRVLEVMPRNPLIMADAERAQLAHGFRDLLSKLRPGQTLQFYVETSPVDLASLLERVREQVRHFAGDPPLGAVANGDDLALARWRLYAALEDSLRRHADHQAAVRTRMFVVMPYLPPLRSMRERLGQLRSGGSLPRGPLQRELGAHRRVVRESLAHANAIGAELSALGLPNRLLNGEEVAELLWRRFNPTRADSGRDAARAGVRGARRSGRA